MKVWLRTEQEPRFSIFTLHQKLPCPFVKTNTFSHIQYMVSQSSARRRNLVTRETRNVGPYSSYSKLKGLHAFDSRKIANLEANIDWIISRQFEWLLPSISRFWPNMHESSSLSQKYTNETVLQNINFFIWFLILLNSEIQNSFLKNLRPQWIQLKIVLKNALHFFTKIWR